MLTPPDVQSGQWQPSSLDQISIMSDCGMVASCNGCLISHARFQLSVEVGEWKRG